MGARFQQASHQHNHHVNSKKHYEISLSRSSLVLLLSSSLVFAFGAGYMAKSVWIRYTVHHEDSPVDQNDASLSIPGEGLAYMVNDGSEAIMPLPYGGDTVKAKSVYTYADFDEQGLWNALGQQQQQGVNTSDISLQNNEYDHDHLSLSTQFDAEDKPVSSTGQHLILDMQGVNGDFLNSNVQLSQALVEAARLANIRLRSYHCHALIPMGVTCVGLLERGHLSFHTWPQEGVILLDIYAWGGELKQRTLARFLDTMKRLFGPSSEEDPLVLWSQKRRGFHSTEMTDSEGFVSDPGIELKLLVASIQTPFQLIEVYDEIHTRDQNGMEEYKKSLLEDDSYYSQHKEFFCPNREVYLNGMAQSSRDSDAIYHEALVHPAMFAHDGPQRVAIIGGGEGATLREVLKHSTVQQAIMVEIDAVMMNASRTYLPEWNSCQNLVGSTDNCFDEPRANVYAEDALAWFIDRFHTNDGTIDPNEKGLENAEPIDVIIMDALDPQDDSDFCAILYENDVFFESLYDALTDDGILVMQLGEAPDRDNPAETLSSNHHRAEITQELQELGFESIHVYEEGNCGFEGTWSYLVAFKDRDSRANWYANEAQVELQMLQRGMSTKSGLSPFVYFDGATMVSYQTPHRAWEHVYCRAEPTPESCKDLSNNVFVVKDECVDFTAQIPSDTLDLLLDLEDELEESSGLGSFGDFMEDSREELDNDEMMLLVLETCPTNETLQMTTNITASKDVSGHLLEKGLFNPVLDRHCRSFHNNENLVLL